MHIKKHRRRVEQGEGVKRKTVWDRNPWDREKTTNNLKGSLNKPTVMRSHKLRSVTKSIHYT